MDPKIALCNIFSNLSELKAFARKHGFTGIDWSFDLDTLPETPSEESRWVKDLSVLQDFEIRYHCPFYQIDLGHNDPEDAKKARTIFRHIIRLVSKAGGEYLTVHIGLGHDSTEPLSWDATIESLKELVQFGAEQRVKICLENLAWGWTSKPNLFEKLVRKSGAAVTLDIGHAHACEVVQTQLYDIEDFISPHEGHVLNAHIYHTEISGLGHVPPEHLEDIQSRLDLLQKAGCKWWAIEIKEPDGLLHTKGLIDEYMTKRQLEQQLIGNNSRLSKAATGL